MTSASDYATIAPPLGVDDIPAKRKELSTLKVPDLKRWLLCRGASARGKKADLVLR